MSNTQVATLVQTILMIGPGIAALFGVPQSTSTTAASIVSMVLGGVWNHFAALQANKAPANVPPQ